MNRCSGSLAKVGHWRFAGPSRPLRFSCLPSLPFPSLPSPSSPLPLVTRLLFPAVPVGLCAHAVPFTARVRREAGWCGCFSGRCSVCSQSVALLPGSDRCELIRASSYRPQYETCTRQCNFHTRDREKKFPGSPFRATWKLLVCSKPACL